MSVKIVKGDILNAREQCIVHQANCVTKSAGHLAAVIFKRFPYANNYKFRTNNPKTFSVPGSIDIFGGRNKRCVINLYGQYNPGPPTPQETDAMRMKWFKSGLRKIGRIQGLTSVAIPWRIGSGAAGGDWASYLEAIVDFADDSGIRVVIYKL